PPGKYQLRVGAREPGGRIGTVLYDLEAPDFSKGTVAMSGIALASASGSLIPPASPDLSVKEFSDLLPSPPSASRDFPRTDTPAGLAQVYAHGRQNPHHTQH